MNDKTPRGVLQLTLLIDLGKAYLEALQQSLLEDVPHPAVERLKVALDTASFQIRQTGQIADRHLMKIQSEMEFWRANRPIGPVTDAQLDHREGRLTEDGGVSRKLDS